MNKKCITMLSCPTSVPSAFFVVKIPQKIPTQLRRHTTTLCTFKDRCLIYLNLSVNNIQEAQDFYSKKIGLFTGSYNRLICESGPELIIDLLEVGSEEHLRVFESDSHVKSSFTILHEDKTKLELLNRLKEHGVEFQNEPNMMAEFIDVKDPSGNAISIGASHGCIS